MSKVTHGINNKVASTAINPNGNFDTVEGNNGSVVVSDCSGYAGYAGYAGGVVYGNAWTDPLGGLSPSPTPLLATDTHLWNNYPQPAIRCSDSHRITAELMVVDGNEAVGTCQDCGIRVFIPCVPGAFSFERAGGLVGRAMSLGEEDDELSGELLAEIAILQEQLDKDIRRFKRSMEVLQIAKGMAKKNALKIAEPVG